MWLRFVQITAVAVILLAGLSVGQKLRFDTVYYICPQKSQADGTKNLSYTCPAKTNSKNYCQCGWDFDQLNLHSNHYMAIGGPIFLDQVVAGGNKLAYLVDKFHKHRKLSGAKAAQKIIDLAKHYFATSPTGLPRYLLLNEITTGWHRRADKAYINWIIQVAKKLKESGFQPIMFTQNFNPLRYKKSAYGWKSLAKYAYIAVETYLNTEKIVKMADNKRAAFMKRSYQTYVTSYGKVGVPKNKLLLTEHYGNTAKGRTWGRSGVSQANWIRIINLRNQVFKSLNLFGVVTYGWFSNTMQVTTSKRKLFYDAYNSGSHLLP
jgi:hypothetical protein